MKHLRYSFLQMESFLSSFFSNYVRSEGKKGYITFVWNKFIMMMMMSWSLGMGDEMDERN